ncbi:hypothetical protein ARMGADRAFT_1034852 [Armillaria gallica]|uniref:Uncharacterized protein n=1 Tax=Armillaria gallica TaxID=47427 RepID=A0A2H3CZN8_ARMGA|nr:hypothetical protein ARMGADRAFT_1034852 [Armillaria gallica]
MSEPLDDTTPDPNDIYFTGALYQLYSVEPPCFSNDDQHYLHDDYSLQRQRTEGVLALSLANRIHPLSSPSLSITLSDRRCGGIREHITHVWAAHTSSPTLEDASTTVIAKFYDPLYFHDEYESVDPLCLAAQSVASEVKAYEMLLSLQGICIPRCLGLYATAIPQQDGRTAYVLLSELVAGKGLQYLCETGDEDGDTGDEDGDVLGDYLCENHREAIFATMFRLALDFVSRGVFHADWAPGNVIIRPPARPGPFCCDEHCPARFEIDADDVGATMIDFERVYLEDPPDPKDIHLVRRMFTNVAPSEYFVWWFRNLHSYPSLRLDALDQGSE